MDKNGTSRSFLEDLEELLKFLKSLWGTLGGISVFFPLSNTLLQAIPLSSEVIFAFTPGLITALASVFTVYFVFDSFVRRFELINKPEGPKLFRSAAWRWLWAGTAMLIAYLVLYAFKPEIMWEWLQITSDDARQTFYDIPLMVLYTGFFICLTKAFMLLGMIEFYRRRDMRIEHSDMD